MSERVMLALGEFRFEIETAAYQKLSLNQSWRWPEQARINRDPALQFVGRGTDEISLDGVIYPGFKGGLEQVEAMRDLADKGKPQPLVDGLGRVWGPWVITDISDTRSVLADNGQPRKIDFSLKLKAYGEDEKSRGTLRRITRQERSALMGLGGEGLTDPLDIDAAQDQFNTLDAVAAALPEITPAMTPTELQAAASAAHAVASGVAQVLAGAAQIITGAINGAISGLAQDVLNALPASALKAISTVQSAVGDIIAIGRVLQVLQEPMAIAGGRQVSPAALLRDVAGLDGQLRLSAYGAGSAARSLRDTAQTFAAVARIASPTDAPIRQGVASALNAVAGHAERFTALCTQAQGCTTSILEDWHV
jgi:hypothetical protein